MRDMLGNPLELNDVVVIADAALKQYHTLASLSLARIITIYDKTDTVEVILFGTPNHNRYATAPQLLRYTDQYRQMHPALIEELFQPQEIS